MAASGFSVAHNRLNEGLLFTKLRERRFGFPTLQSTVGRSLRDYEVFTELASTLPLIPFPGSVLFLCSLPDKFFELLISVLSCCSCSHGFKRESALQGAFFC